MGFELVTFTPIMCNLTTWIKHDHIATRIECDPCSSCHILNPISLIIRFAPIHVYVRSYTNIIYSATNPELWIAEFFSKNYSCIFFYFFFYLSWLTGNQVLRNLCLWLSLLLILPFNFMGGSPFSSLWTTSCLWGLIKRLIMNTLACGISMRSWLWTPGSGVPFSTVGKQSLSTHRLPMCRLVNHVNCLYLLLILESLILKRHIHLTEKVEISSVALWPPWIG